MKDSLPLFSNSISPPIQKNLSHAPHVSNYVLPFPLYKVEILPHIGTIRMNLSMLNFIPSLLRKEAPRRAGLLSKWAKFNIAKWAKCAGRLSELMVSRPLCWLSTPAYLLST